MEPNEVATLKKDCIQVQNFLTSVTSVLPDHILKIIQPASEAAEEAFLEEDYLTSFHRYTQIQNVLREWSLKHSCNGSTDSLEDNNDHRLFTPFRSEHPVYFKDIVGLQDCKRILREVLVYPALYPHLLPQQPRGVLGILMFGFAGCGKSLLAQATAAEIQAPFYNVQLSHLQSKYRGESENRVRILFETLRQHDVAVLFIDEVDAVTGTRDGKDNMLAFKNELLVEMSGVKSNSSNTFIVVLAATNMPETLDDAFLSRFRYKLFVPLPDMLQRIEMIKQSCHSLNVRLSKPVEVHLGKQTEGFSGRDIAGILESLKYVPLRKIQQAKFFRLVITPENVEKYAVADNTEGHAFASSAETLGFTNLVQPCISEEDILSAFNTHSIQRTDLRPGLMAFARKYCNTNDDDETSICKSDTTTCCAAIIMCTMWGK